jgi:hypothetical protein
LKRGGEQRLFITESFPELSRESRWPRLMTAKTASEYVDESPRSFLRAVGKTYPPPRMVPNRGKRWLKDDLDEAIDQMAKGTDRLEM